MFRINDAELLEISIGTFSPRHYVIMNMISSDDPVSGPGPETGKRPTDPSLVMGSGDLDSGLRPETDRPTGPSLMLSSAL